MVSLELAEGLTWLQEFIRTKPTLLVGTGLSMAMGLPGMDELHNHLKTSVPGACNGDSGLLAEWAGCSVLISNHGLEGGLARTTVSSALLNLIVGETAAFVESRDVELRRRLNPRSLLEFPFARLLRHLVNSMPPGERIIDVITSNYDHVVEYACDMIAVPCCTGFEGACVQPFRDDALSSSLYTRVVTSGKRRDPRHEYRKVDMVRILKPHGSLWWQKIDDFAFQCPDRIPGASRILITPGLSKYFISLTDPVMNQVRELANTSLAGARSVMVIGYGFNDDHLQTVLLKRISSGMRCLVLARALTENAASIVSQHSGVLAIEHDDCGCRWHMGGDSGLWEYGLWDLACFVDLVIGREEG